MTAGLWGLFAACFTTMSPDLRVICNAYTAERIIAPEYRKSLARVAKNCQHLSAKRINQYLDSRLHLVSSTTVKNERAMLLILWRWAYERGLVPTHPRGVAKVRADRTPVQAWTLEQCCTAVKGAAMHSGKKTRNGADRGEFLRCWLLLGYETGARWADIWKFRDKHFDGNQLRYSQNKTGNPINQILSDQCVDSVRRMLARSPDGTVVGWVCGKRRAMRVMKAHLKDCGLRGTSKWLRRSSATHIEMSQPGRARLFLGHKSPGMAERHYIDWAQVRKDIPRPPGLSLN